MWANSKTISSKEVFNHPRLSLVEDEVEAPNGTRTKYLKHKDTGSHSVVMVTVRDNGDILMFKEFFYPIQKTLYQFPGGVIHADEDLVAGANRELMEEAGLSANRIEPLGEYYMEARRSKTKMYVYKATELEESSLKRDLEEEIERLWLSHNEIESLIRNKKIQNIQVLAAWGMYTMNC